MEEKKVRVCKRCGTEVRTIFEPTNEDIKLGAAGQYYCSNCDPGGINFISKAQTEFKNIQGMSIEQEIELSMKAKEEVEKNEPTVFWDDEPIPGKGWND